MSTPTPIQHVAVSLHRRYGLSFIAHISGVPRRTLSRCLSGGAPSSATEVKLRACKARLYGFRYRELLMDIIASTSLRKTAAKFSVHVQTIVDFKHHSVGGHLSTYFIEELLTHWEDAKADTRETARINKLKYLKEYRDEK